MNEHLLKISDRSVKLSLNYGSYNDITWFFCTSMITVKYSEAVNSSMNFNEIYIVDSENRVLHNEMLATLTDLSFLEFQVSQGI